MRKRRFVQIRLDSWEDAVVLGKGLAGHVFRGQSDAKWLLFTTIERAARRYGFPDGALRNREVVLLNNFQRRAHQYVDDPPSLEDRLEWLALMQHHGAPTRLVDLSHSFYVAAFFAMESAEQDAAIWALSTEFTMGHTSNLLSETQTMLDLEAELRAVLQAHLSGHQTSTCVMLVEPHRMNARLAVQQGCFVVPGDLSKSFMENLTTVLKSMSPRWRPKGPPRCGTEMPTGSSTRRSSRSYCPKQSTTRLCGILIR
jgi:hypothetical protein